MAVISPDERLRRQGINASVLGSHAMEGLFPDAATIALMDRYADGELDRAQLSAEIDKHVQTLLFARGKTEE